MSDWEWFLFTIGLMIAWIIIVVFLNKKEVLKKYRLQLYGPFIMWKTVKGRKLLAKMARKKRFWAFYGDMSIVITLGAMLTILGLLAWSAVYVLTIPPSRAPDAKLIVGLPGINPVIPLWYGIFALAVAIILHEGAHGILAILGKLKIKSLGLLFFIIPVGAFVEPDEEALKETNARVRDRMAAVGPATNILFAILCAFIFSSVFMSALQPEVDGLIISGVEKDTPAEMAGIKPGMVIVWMNLTNETGEVGSANITEYRDFIGLMKQSSEFDNITLKVYYKDEFRWLNVTLGRSGNYTENSNHPDRGYIGIYMMPRSTVNLLDTLKDPIGSARDPGEMKNNMLTYSISLPFSGIVPFHEPITDIYEPTGPVASLGEPAFWVFANIFYWLFWLNLMVGLSNSLPAIPFDGSYIYQDGLIKFYQKRKLSEEDVNRKVRRAMLFTTFLMFFLILWQVIGPRFSGLFQ